MKKHLTKQKVVTIKFMRFGFANRELAQEFCDFINTYCSWEEAAVYDSLENLNCFVQVITSTEHMDFYTDLFNLIYKNENHTT